MKHIHIDRVDLEHMAEWLDNPDSANKPTSYEIIKALRDIMNWARQAETQIPHNEPLCKGLRDATERIEEIFRKFSESQ